MTDLNPTNVKVAIVMMRRASCTGDEAANVAMAIAAFEQLFQSMAAAAQAQALTDEDALLDKEDTDGDDTDAS